MRYPQTVYPRAESNRNRRNRNPKFYPLNYGGRTIGKKEAFPNRTANIVQFPFISPFFLYFCDRNPYPQPHADTGNSEY